MAPHSIEVVVQSGEVQERVIIAFLTLSWLFISLRIWTRIFIISNFGWDDGFMLLSCSIFTVFCGMLLVGQASSAGSNVTSVDQILRLSKYVIVGEAAYILTIMFLKISLGIFFARIVVKRWHFTLIYVTIGLNVFSSVAAFFFSIFRCGADMDQYLFKQISRQCTPFLLDRFMAYQHASINTMTDLMLLVIPVVLLWNANMKLKSKVSAGLVLGLATAGCICSMIRFRYIEGFLDYSDFLWNIVNISIWSTIEAGTCIIAGCLATLRPFGKFAFHRVRESAVLSEAVKRYSRSFGPGVTHGRSNKSPQPQDSIPLTAIDSKITHSECQVSQSTINKEPVFHEFVASPGQEVISLSSDMSNRRTSTDSILGQRAPGQAKFAWPVESEGSGRKDDKKRQTIHDGWSVHRDDSWSTPRDTASSTRTSIGPTSVPSSPGLDWYIEKAV